MKRLLLPLVLLLAACGGSKPMAEKPRDHEGGQATSQAGEKGKRALVMDLFMQATQARLKGDLPKAVQLFRPP